MSEPAKKLDKKFIRDGAKYVCTQCKKKFFTREEVEKCYDSHGVSGSK